MSVIRRLPAEVVNRIAAGEVVQRPSAALKELLENALDAGSTTITVTAVDGGLELLQVSDDGCGVNYDDLPLLCARYATSKLRTFADLQHIHSFGFRGEALASISYVARVTVITRCRASGAEATHTTDGDDEDSNNSNDNNTQKGGGNDDGGARAMTDTAHTSRRHRCEVAWLCRYRDGEPVQAPEACARSAGTTIRVEKMFYNTAVRRAALRPGEEWSRIVDVVTRYAFAFPHVSFTCTRATPGSVSSSGSGNSGSDVHFPRHSTTLDNICLAHGRTIASHLHLIHSLDEDDKSDDDNDDDDKSDDEEETRTTSATAPRRRRRRRGDEDADVWRRYAAAARRVEALREDDVGVVGSRRNNNNTGDDDDDSDACAGRHALAGYASDSGLQQLSKTQLCLFVNRRLVESSAVRRAVEAVYSAVLPAHRRPFVVLFVTLPPQRVDVNVHPTKKEVSILDEDLILSRLTRRLQDMLTTTAASRAMPLSLRSSAATASYSSSSSFAARRTPFAQDSAATASAAAAATPTVTAPVLPPSYVVRVEPQKGALDRFLRAHNEQTQLTTTTTSCTATREQPRSNDSSGVAAAVADMCTPSTAGAAETTTAAATAVAAPAVCAPQLARSNRDGVPVVTSVHDDDDDDDDAVASDLMLEFKRHRSEVYASLGEAAEARAAHTQAAATTATSPAAAAAALVVARTADDGGGGGVDTAVGNTDDKAAGIAASLLQYCVRSDATRAAPAVDQASCTRTLQERSRSDDDNNNTMTMSSTALVPVGEVVDRVLTSVQRVVRDMAAASSSDAARRLVRDLVYVGVANAYSFFAQAGTVLYMLDTLRCVRLVVYQRIFLRWAQPALPRPACFVFATPLPLRALLLFAVRHDAAHLTGLPAALQLSVLSSSSAAAATHEPDGSACMTAAVNDNDDDNDDDDVHAYVQPLLRRLSRWRAMLADYFDVHITDDGCLAALPCGLNKHWPPLLRAVPLFVWQLAATVPYPDDDTDTSDSTKDDEEAATVAERRCFERVAHCIADTLYGLAPHRALCMHDDKDDKSSRDDECNDDEDEEADDDIDECSGGSRRTACGPSSSTSRAADKQSSSSNGSGSSGSSGSGSGNYMIADDAAATPSLEEAVQHGLLPCLKNTQLCIVPASLLNDGTVHAVVSVEALYKVFERC